MSDVGTQRSSGRGNGSQQQNGGNGTHASTTSKRNKHTHIGTSSVSTSNNGAPPPQQMHPPAAPQHAMMQPVYAPHAWGGAAPHQPIINMGMNGHQPIPSGPLHYMPPPHMHQWGMYHPIAMPPDMSHMHRWHQPMLDQAAPAPVSSSNRNEPSKSNGQSKNAASETGDNEKELLDGENQKEDQSEKSEKMPSNESHMESQNVKVMKKSTTSNTTQNISNNDESKTSKSNHANSNSTSSSRQSQPLQKQAPAPNPPQTPHGMNGIMPTWPQPAMMMPGPPPMGGTAPTIMMGMMPPPDQMMIGNGKGPPASSFPPQHMMHPEAWIGHPAVSQMGAPVIGQPLSGRLSGSPPGMMSCNPANSDEAGGYIKTAKNLQKDKGRGNYRCGRCGVPKKGHICPYQAKTKRKVDDPLPEMKNSAIQVEMDEYMVIRRLNLEIQGFPETYVADPKGDMVGSETFSNTHSMNFGSNQNLDEDNVGNVATVKRSNSNRRIDI